MPTAIRGWDETAHSIISLSLWLASTDFFRIQIAPQASVTCGDSSLRRFFSDSLPEIWQHVFASHHFLMLSLLTFPAASFTIWPVEKNGFKFECVVWYYSYREACNTAVTTKQHIFYDRRSNTVFGFTNILRLINSALFTTSKWVDTDLLRLRCKAYVLRAWSFARFSCSFDDMATEGQRGWTSSPLSPSSHAC